MTMPPELLDELWKPEYLERLARAYWRWLSRVTLGLIRVVYAEDSRSAVLLTRRLPLLSFHAPEYDTEPGHGLRHLADRARAARRPGGPRPNGFLRIRVRRARARTPAGGRPRPSTCALEVRNFYPWLRGSGRFARFGAWLYGQTQLRIHVLVCNGFLRSLARLDLPPSRVGALAGEIDAGSAAEADPTV